MKALHIAAFTLVIVGALNWGLVALNLNLVEMIFGSVPGLVTIIYGLVGVSAVYIFITHMQDCKICSKGK